MRKPTEPCSQGFRRNLEIKNKSFLISFDPCSMISLKEIRESSCKTFRFFDRKR
jgi:hypothetical protein